MIILVVVILVIIIWVAIMDLSRKEQFDAENTYPYYRDPYSLYLWNDVNRRLDYLEEHY